MRKNRVLMVVTSVSRMNREGEATGFWLSEVTHPYFAMVDRGIDVHIVSIQGGKPPIDPRSLNMEDADNARFMKEKKLAALLEDTKALNDIDSYDYRGIVFAGGHGTMWDFPEGEGVVEKSMEIYERGGVVAAICHGPAALINIKLDNGKYLIKGRRIAAFTNEEESIAGFTGVVPFSLEDKLKDRGCEYIKGDPWSVNVQQDGQLITGQNPQSARGVGDAVAEFLSMKP